MAKLVSDPWFRAAVTSQVGLCAHSIHQFPAGLAVLESVLASCAGQPAVDVQGRECSDGQEGSLNLRGA